ncbi:MAG: S41 family peptidase [Acidimicrobiia bacterium]|nr:S41 family peptidase [Acidimicrobiia bacterium]
MTAQYGYYRHPTIAGDTVVFVSEDDLWSVTAAGGTAHRLTANPGSVSFPKLSPDGSQVAFTGRDEGQSDAYVMDIDGGPARRLTYWGATTHVAGWKHDGLTVFVSSDWAQPFSGWQHLHEVPTDGRPKTALNLGPARAISFAPGGDGVVIGRFSLDPARWKRYRGGRAGTLWIDRGGTGEFAPLVSLVGNLADPMWIGRRIYFISDHEGHGNLYSVTPTGRGLKRHTNHEDFFARFAASDGKRIVYHCGADLWLFDPATDEAGRLDVTVPSARPQRNRKFQSPGKHLESIDVHPQGHSLAVVARGAAFTMPAWEGAPTRHGEVSAHRSRLATWLPDGERFVAVTDALGEEQLVIRSADGTGEPRYIGGDIGRARDLAVAPTGTDRVVVTNHRHEVILVNLERGSQRTLYRSSHSWIHGTSWSPDGRWIAFSASPSRTTAGLYLADARTGRVRQITDGAFSDAVPAFDTSGKYLHFLSSRTFDPVPDALQHDYGFPKAYKPHLLVLDESTPSPFNAELRAPRPPGAPPSGNGDSKSGKDKKSEGPAETRIDFEGLSDRIVAYPMPHARYKHLVAGHGRVLMTSFPVSGALPRPPAEQASQGKLEAYDFAADKVETVMEGVSGVAVALDGKTMAIAGDKKVRLVPIGYKGDKNGPDQPGRDGGMVDLDRIRIEVQPPEEWGQMFSEAWRLQRDYFWREDMAEVDWQSVHERYRPLVDRVASRAEFSDLMWEMQGELGTSHAYEMGGDYRPEPTYKQGSLGIDAERLPRGGWRLTEIHRGDVWDPTATSPLGAPGVGVRPGDRIVAIDGVDITKASSPNLALADRAGRAVTVTIRRASQRPRTVAVKALATEFRLRYRDWVEGNRRYVADQTEGRAGYIHIPDMGPGGFAEFHRSWLADLDKDGLVVDVRFNRGGNVSQLLLQKLLRRRIGYRVTRWREPTGFPYESPTGPMVCLTNENSGSDGDIFSHTFKLHGLGPLIGTRTWGGVTGIWPQQALVDGTVTTQPEFGTWFTDVGFAVENYGTDPDIEVVITPQDYLAGRDPQMDRGIAELVAIIEAAGPLRAELGPHPSMKPPRLPRD